MNLRIRTTLFVLLALPVAACQKDAPKPSGGQTDTTTPTPPPPTPTPPPPTPAPAPTPPPEPPPMPALEPSGEVVRETVAADLEELVKDLPGKGDKIKAEIKTSEGTFHCELFADKVPMTVANFIGLATGKKAWLNTKTNQIMKNAPFYDGLTFHRVMKRFMIQGGDPLGNGTGGPGYTIAEETRPDLKHTPGTMSMAKTSEPHSTGSQFFITEVATEMLDGGYSAFGRCKEVDLVKKITAFQGQGGDAPTKRVTIEKVTISRGS